MSEPVPEPIPTPIIEPSPEDIAQMIAASMGVPHGMRTAGSGGWSLRGKLLGAIVIAGVGLGASAMSCIGQSFSLRQARALEAIQAELKELRASCAPATQIEAPR